MLVWTPITVRINEPTKMLDRKTAREDSLARSMPVISVGSETLNSTLIVAILHQGIERSKGTRVVENSSESIPILTVRGVTAFRHDRDTVCAYVGKFSRPDRGNDGALQ